MEKHDLDNIIKPLRKTLGLFESALAAVDDSIAIFQNGKSLIWCNKSFEALTGETRLTLLGKSIGECLSRYSSKIDLNRIYEIAAKKHNGTLNIFLEDKEEDQHFAVESHVTRHEQNEKAFTIIIKNITDKYNAKKFEKEAFLRAEEADTCYLTGLLNRRGIMKMINKSFDKDEGGGFYIIFCDVNNFKSINDSYGHEVGDEVLKMLSTILERCVRKSDFIGRISGDEFVIGVITPEKSLITPDHIARRILEETKKGLIFRRSGEKVNIDFSVSLGIADSALATDSQTLMHMSDVAMYEAKKHKSGVAFYNHKLKEEDKRLGFIKGVSEDLFSKKFIPFHIQPIVETLTNKVIGYETLMRPISSDGILISAQKFVQMHELNGDIQALDLLMIKSVCTTISSEFLQKGKLFLTINISAISIGSKDFLSRMLDIIKTSDLNSAQLIVEITETALIDNRSTFDYGIRCLKEKGIPVFLDDFGVGNTSCDELINLPIGGFKVDASLFNLSKNQPKALSVLRFLSTFGIENDLCVIAEGIETDEDLKHAINIGYKCVQGYKLSPPFPYKYFFSPPNLEDKIGSSCLLSQKISHPFL